MTNTFSLKVGPKLEGMSHFDLRDGRNQASIPSGGKGWVGIRTRFLMNNSWGFVDSHGVYAAFLLVFDVPDGGIVSEDEEGVPAALIRVLRECVMDEIGSLADKDSMNREFRRCVASEVLQDYCFEACEFVACQFSESGFRRTTFIDCKFVDCDLSLAAVNESVFNGVDFSGCRLLGIDWSCCNANLFSVRFTRSTLDSSIFDGMKLKRASFQKCSLVGAFFNSCELQEASFRGSQLKDCSFEGADLRRADFRETESLDLDFSSPKLRGLKLDMMGAVALMRKNGIVVE